jgi:hypothetical protein
MGREHSAHDREHHVEALVGEQRRLGVALDPVDLHAGGDGLAAGGLELVAVDIEQPVS